MFNFLNNSKVLYCTSYSALSFYHKKY